MNTLRNHVNLIGRLGQDPEFKTFDGGKKMTRLSIVTNERYKNSAGETVNDSQWHNVVAWGTQADYINKYYTKGAEVAVSGKLVSRSYQDKNGEKKYITEIHLNEITPLGKRKETESAG